MNAEASKIKILWLHITHTRNKSEMKNVMYCRRS